MFGQKYFPMPTEKASWRYVTPDGWPGLPPKWDWYGSGSDTVFNGINYPTILGKSDNYWFREVNKKVYALNFKDSSETIMLDFTLSVGDTFIWDTSAINNRLAIGILDSTDSVVVLNQYHKRYYFHDQSLPDPNQPWCIWVEGIGNLNNFFGYPFINPKGMTFTALCNFYMYDSFAYYDGHYCGPEAIANINPEPLDIQFHPNPASDILYLNALKNHPNFQLIDITGRVILSRKIYTGNSTLNIEEIPQGMYYIKVENGFVGKFVKL